MKNENTLELDQEKKLLNELLKDIAIDDFSYSEDDDTDDIEKDDNNTEEDEEDIDEEELLSIYEAFKDYVMIDGILQYKNLLDDTQLHELFKGRIDIQSLLSDENIITEYRYASAQRKSAKFITNTLEPLLIGVEITDDEYSILSKNISERLDNKTEEYFTKLKEEVEKIPTEEVFGFLYRNDKNYLNFMILNGLDIADRDLVIYTLYNYYPWYIKTLCSDDIRGVYRAYQNKRKKDARAYKSQSITKDIDIQMKELLFNNYTDRITEMYKNNLSFNKIQKILTAECINKNEIPATIKRYDRSSNTEKVLVERPTLLSMSVIKKIIKDANMQIAKVGRYSKAS